MWSWWLETSLSQHTGRVAMCLQQQQEPSKVACAAAQQLASRPFAMVANGLVSATDYDHYELHHINSNS